VKSRINKLEAHLFVNNKLETRGFISNYIPLSKIFCLVGKRPQLKGHRELKYSILSDGMDTPIILLDNNEWNYTMSIRQVKKEWVSNYQSHYDFIAYSGNQRLKIAKELEFSKISCVVAEDVHWAHAIHLILNKGSIEHTLS
jgi:hypothetical protein